MLEEYQEESLQVVGSRVRRLLVLLLELYGVKRSKRQVIYRSFTIEDTDQDHNVSETEVEFLTISEISYRADRFGMELLSVCGRNGERYRSLRVPSRLVLI